MKFKAIEFETAHQAIEHSEASGGCAIWINNKNLSVTAKEAERLMDSRISFAYLADHNGTIATIPVNA